MKSYNLYMKQRKKLTQKQNNILIINCIINSIIMFILLQKYTIPNETKNFHGITLSEYLNIVYKNFHPDFDYFNGLWLIPSGLFIISILLLLEIPDIKIKKEKKN